MKYFWNDVELSEEEYNKMWNKMLEQLRLLELKEEEEMKASRKKISDTKNVKKKK